MWGQCKLRQRPCGRLLRDGGTSLEKVPRNFQILPRNLKILRQNFSISWQFFCVPWQNVGVLWQNLGVIWQKEGIPRRNAGIPWRIPRNSRVQSWRSRRVFHKCPGVWGGMPLHTVDGCPGWFPRMAQGRVEIATFSVANMEKHVLNTAALHVFAPKNFESSLFFPIFASALRVVGGNAVCNAGR